MSAAETRAPLKPHALQPGVSRPAIRSMRFEQNNALSFTRARQRYCEVRPRGCPDRCGSRHWTFHTHQGRHVAGCSLENSLAEGWFCPSFLQPQVSFNQQTEDMPQLGRCDIYHIYVARQGPLHEHLQPDAVSWCPNSREVCLHPSPHLQQSPLLHALSKEEVPLHSL
jgi:hypothetical protein